ncbi:MAG TPA: DUF5309 family protein [Candidatus Gallibacteroides avistercoris]|uniref:DUF5309 family protein n=1 Tax=Candidatus Gallibacteroides avistercoris TaxID=2840833 RepID=A0A9D1M9P7_9BACT|nr:DUF5309 family protein [Candidatus Gallibacteroides avistercoris]
MRKKVLQFLKSENFLLFALALIAIAVSLCSNDGVLVAAVFAGASGSKIVSGESLTTDISRKESPDLLMNEVDNVITKIRPLSTPIDQISRVARARKSQSMIVDYYSVDVKPSRTTVKTEYTEPGSEEATTNAQRVKLVTANDEIFEVSETLLVPGLKGYEADGTTVSKSDLVLYVSSKDEDGSIYVYAINGKKIGTIENCVPSLSAGQAIIRMGRAATELDVQTGQFEALPVKEQNFCQIFKMQVEESTLQKIAKKNVPWRFSDSEEAAIFDMRLGMEKTFMFGVKRQIYDAKKKESVYLTGGIWWQAGKEYEYDASAGFTQNDLVDIMKEAFTGNGGTKRKMLVGGSDLIAAINKMEITKVINASETTAAFGMDFTQIVSKFGKLGVIFSEVFDDCGMSGYGFIVDPDLITKWSHIPFGKEQLDLKKAGIRNVDATVLTEASCLTLRYPAAHMRIVPQGA